MANNSGQNGWARLITAHWRGDRHLTIATAIPIAAMGIVWGAIRVGFDSVDWVWHYQLVAPVLIGLIGLLLATAVWGLVGAARSGVREHQEGESTVRVHLMVSIVAACALATAGEFAFHTSEWISALWVFATDSEKRATVTADPALGRLVVRGRMGFGTTRRVKEVFQTAPWVRLVELESPGGYAIEGLALARLLEKQGIDTLVLKKCASACITAFAAGNRRFLGSHGWLGLHSAGGDPKDVRALNEQEAKFLRAKDVAEWLIKGEMETPFEDIWGPGPATLLGSGLVTDMWRGDESTTADVVPGAGS